MTEPHRPLAVVTGAANGIGLALAREFARHEFDLVIAGDGVQRVADELGAEALQADLATPDGVRELHARVRHRHVAALALNAGTAGRGDGLERELGLVDRNCRSLVQLARVLTAEMVATGRGRVLVAAPVTEAHPGPHQAAFKASRAFARTFGTSLRRELREHGVSVTVLEPPPDGATADDPAAIAGKAFEALMAGRETVVAPSIATKATHLVARLIPEAFKGVAGLVTRPR